MKQYLLTFLVAACAACSHVVAPVEARLRDDAIAAATASTQAAPGPGQTRPQGGRPW